MMDKAPEESVETDGAVRSVLSQMDWMMMLKEINRNVNMENTV